MKSDFLRLADRSPAQYRALFERAHELKARHQERREQRPPSFNTLAGRTLVLLFEKPSTRTRLSFEAAMFQLGGSALTLNAADSQMGRGETLADTARVISRYADAIVLRTFADERLAEFARAATVPVINGLTDSGHPVQLVADLFTIEERLGSVPGKVVLFVGDGSSNMARSWIEAAPLFQFTLRLASPSGFEPPESELRAAGERVLLTRNPLQGAAGADVIATDVWTSMGQEAEANRRRSALRGFAVDEKLLEQAKPGCIVLHCLPAHRGEEIAAEVMDGPQSAVFQEAENRLHVQKALLEQLLLNP